MIRSARAQLCGWHKRFCSTDGSRRCSFLSCYSLSFSGVSFHGDLEWMTMLPSVMHSHGPAISRVERLEFRIIEKYRLLAPRLSWNCD